MKSLSTFDPDTDEIAQRNVAAPNKQQTQTLHQGEGMRSHATRTSKQEVTRSIILSKQNLKVYRNNHDFCQTISVCIMISFHWL